MIADLFLARLTSSAEGLPAAASPAPALEGEGDGFAALLEGDGAPLAESLAEVESLIAEVSEAEIAPEEGTALPSMPLGVALREAMQPAPPLPMAQAEIKILPEALPQEAPESELLLGEDLAEGEPQANPADKLEDELAADLALNLLPPIDVPPPPPPSAPQVAFALPPETPPESSAGEVSAEENAPEIALELGETRDHGPAEAPQEAPAPVKSEPSLVAKAPDQPDVTPQGFEERLAAREIAPNPPKAAPQRPELPPLVRNVIERMEEVNLQEGNTRVLLKPQGLGLLEIDMSSAPDGRMNLTIRAENPMVLEALKQESGALSLFMGQKGFDLSGGEPQLDQYQRPKAALVALGEAEEEETVTEQDILASDGLNIVT